MMQTFSIFRMNQKIMTVHAKNEMDALAIAAKLLALPQEQIVARLPLRLHCYKDSCGYKWNYLGARTVSASCPNCGKQVNIKLALMRD